MTVVDEVVEVVEDNFDSLCLNLYEYLNYANKICFVISIQCRFGHIKKVFAIQIRT